MGKQLRLLIVDDAPQVRQGLRALLPLAAEAAGLPIGIAGEASNGGEAVERALTLNPDVVLMDLEMPEMDGYAATRAIKAQRPSVRVIALTVHGAQTARQGAREAGVDAFIEKGASTTALMGAIRAAREEPLESGANGPL